MEVEYKRQIHIAATGGPVDRHLVGGPGGQVSRFELSRINAMERRYQRILQTLAEARAERDQMIGRASAALWKIRQNQRNEQQLKRDRNVAVDELEKIKE